MGSAIDQVLCELISIVKDEASLIVDVHDEIDDIRLELQHMKSFLMDAATKNSLTQGGKTWISQVGDLAYEVEDIIDEYMYKMNKVRGRNDYMKMFRKIIHLPKDLWERHQLATKLQKLKDKIKDVRERNLRYGTERIEGNTFPENHRSMEFRGESSFFLTDDELVGIENERQKLVGWLKDGEPQRITISIVGMGGSGKTTLAAKAFNSQAVKKHFHCSAWITVSQTYTIEELFRSMMKEICETMKEAFPPDLNTMSYRQLVEKLVYFLESIRYLIVLDDVWNLNLWNEIKVSLPNRRNGSRILLTTRKEEVASLAFEVGSQVHHVKPLSEDEAFTLFCMKAFQRNAGRCPPELEGLANGIVKICDGLPLAIVTLGGVMSCKMLESEWRMVSKSLERELSNNPMLQVVGRILLLSYEELPYMLKRCFLYISLFPEDYLIQRKRLIRLWMAEGLVEQVGGTEPEDVADSYLVELIRRSMLQVVARNSLGRQKMFKMHDLLRELALKISKEEKFGALYDEREGKNECMARRLSLSVHTNERNIQSCEGISKFRSFFLFHTKNSSSSSSKTLPSGFKLLRILDLEGFPLESLPNDMTRLFNLRYLNLKRTQIKELPESIGRLHNLQTLNIDETQVDKLPSEITKLKKLEYLKTCRLNHGIWYEFDYVRGTETQNNICELKNLKVLSVIEATRDVVREMKNMTELVTLGISNVRESYEKDLCTSIQNMASLHGLFVRASNKDEVLRMEGLVSPPPQLQRLSLVAKLEKFPKWFKSLQSLTFLQLNGSSLTENSLQELQALSNLRQLLLTDAFRDRVFNYSEGFNNLELLQIYSCPALNEIVISKGVMPKLKELGIGNCLELRSLPIGIQHLTNLQELTLVNVSKELLEKVRHERCNPNNEGIVPSWRAYIPSINNFDMTSFASQNTIITMDTCNWDRSVIVANSLRSVKLDFSRCI